MATRTSDISHPRLSGGAQLPLSPRVRMPLGKLPLERKKPVVAPATWKPYVRHTVLLACPEGEHVDALAGYLQRQGFKVCRAPNAETVISGIIAGDKTSVLVVSDMPDMTAIELLLRLRKLAVRTPVAMMIDSYDEAYEDIAYEFGAVELLCRTQSAPVISKRLNLLAAGVKRNVKWHGHNGQVGPQEILVNELVLKPASHTALWRGRQVPLTFTEFRIVHLLASHAGRPRTFREIYDVVHGTGFTAGTGPDGHHTNVRSLIRKIRKRFSNVDPTFDQIENALGVGYFWRAPPKRTSALPFHRIPSALQKSVVYDLTEWRAR